MVRLQSSSGNHSQRLFQKTFKGLTAKSMVNLFRQHSKQHRLFPSRGQLLRAATGSLEEKVLKFLLYWVSLQVKKGWCFVNFGLWQQRFFLYVKMKILAELTRSCYRQEPCSIFQSFISLWIKIGNRNKSACCISNPVQSSRSKSTTCLRKGSLFRFQLDSTATSHGNEQQLENNLLHDSELIATKACSQISSKCNVMPCWNLHWLDEFRYSIQRFVGQCDTKNNLLLCYWTTICN